MLRSRSGVVSYAIVGSHYWLELIYYYLLLFIFSFDSYEP